MLKKAIISLSICILVVFVAIAALLVIKPTISNGASTVDSRLAIVYNNGLTGASQREVTRGVKLYKNEFTGIYETKEDTTKLLTPDSFGWSNMGYSFEGWSYQNNILSSGYIPGGITKDDGTIRFIAIWEGQTIQISFNPDHPDYVSQWPNNLIATVGQKMYGFQTGTNQIVPGTVSSDNRVFQGWFTEQGGKGLRVQDGMVCNFTSDTTLYGFWSPAGVVNTQRTIMVQSKVIGSNATGTVFTDINQSFEQGTDLSFTLKNNELGFDYNNTLDGYDEMEGYQFAYFSIGGVNYYDGIDFDNTFVMDLNSDTQVIAWYNDVRSTQYNLNITYKKLNGNSVPYTYPTTKFVYGQLIDLYLVDYTVNQAKIGYVFDHFQINGINYDASSYYSLDSDTILSFRMYGNTQVIAYYK